MLPLLDPRIAGEILLVLPGNRAAAVLATLPARNVGGVLEGMAARPPKAASVLPMMSAARAGRCSP